MAEVAGYTFHHIHIVSSDLAATEAWFVDGVAAELVGRREARGAQPASCAWRACACSCAPPGRARTWRGVGSGDTPPSTSVLG